MSTTATDRIAITGAGAVTAAGWGIKPLLEALNGAELSRPEPFIPPGQEAPVALRRTVPKPLEKLPFLRDPRLRRTSPAGRYLAAAAVEALGEHQPQRLGVIVSCYTGCVNYSQRFYREALQDPATASPIVFPETVFNAPASHLSALLGSDEINYTLVGDQSQYAEAISLATRWLLDDEVDAVLVAASEESDWLTASALGLFTNGAMVAEGAGAVLLERSLQPMIELSAVSDLHTYTNLQPRAAAQRALADQLASWPQASELDPDPEILGEAFGAAPAIHLAAAVARIQSGQSLRIPMHGNNQAAAAVQITRP